MYSIRYTYHILQPNISIQKSRRHNWHMIIVLFSKGKDYRKEENTQRRNGRPHVVESLLAIIGVSDVYF